MPASNNDPSNIHRGWYSSGYLPHFDSPNEIQHITYHLADSLPREALERMKDEVSQLKADQDQREKELRRKIEKFLDAGHGSCILRVPELAVCVINNWRHFDGVRYRLLEWVVMPNHCHVLIEQLEGVPLGTIVLSWKNYTARFINVFKTRTGVRGSQEGSKTGSQAGCQAGCQEGRIRNPAVWYPDYWDRFVRDQYHFQNVRDYIMMNPVEAGLAAKPEDWPWSSAAFREDQ